MPSFDIVSRFNYTELDNAVNNTLKAIAARFDFRGVTAELTVDRKEKTLKLLTDDDGKMRGIREMFLTAASKRGLPGKSFNWGEPEPALAGKSKCTVKLVDGLEQEIAKSIVKLVKESKLKVQASIQGEEVRVNGKQRDDLQAVMKLLNDAELSVPLQYVNFKD